MSDKAYVQELPLCNFCKEDHPAQYDANLPGIGWGNWCEPVFTFHGGKLGTGRGQLLIVGKEPGRTDRERRRAAKEAVEAGDWEAFEDACGDEDPINFL